MNSRLKLPKSYPLTLPLEYAPQLAGVTDEKHPKHYLIAGKVFASSEPAAVTTIVGSGVAICLWDSESGVGGVDHFLLPQAPEDDLSNSKYGTTANEMLLRQVLHLGASVNCLKAKVFGGMQPAVKFGNSSQCLGSRNVEIALSFLTEKGIRLIEKQVGGTQGCKLVFNTDDGCSWLQPL
jgi:chemotaxis protein CheD